MPLLPNIFDSIHLHGVGGRTVKTLHRHNLGAVSALKPDVIILQIGSYEFVANRPAVVGSGIDDSFGSIAVIILLCTSHRCLRG